ncbi:MAG TPA: hypothetical protein VLF71_03975, partial [Candidatus Saccharimonadales bacterium]|nr:hypothetical protein [Candidatus Saccharimonadales bacterium]
ATPATPAVVDPAPAAAPAPTPAPAPEDDSVTISKKKVITPLAPGIVQEKPDLHALLAKEGENLDDSPQAPGMATPPHQPGHVISPTPTNAAGQPVDPNSISL